MDGYDDDIDNDNTITYSSNQLEEEIACDRQSSVSAGKLSDITWDGQDWRTKFVQWGDAHSSLANQTEDLDTEDYC